MSLPKFKFTTGDTVWFMHLNKPRSAVIRQHTLCAIEDPSKTYSQYRISLCIGDPVYSEKDFFESKQKLLESL